MSSLWFPIGAIKDLGVILDFKLTFNLHRKRCLNKALKMLGLIFRSCKDFRNVHSFKVSYYVHVRSHLEFCCIVGKNRPSSFWLFLLFWGPKIVKETCIAQMNIQFILDAAKQFFFKIRSKKISGNSLSNQCKKLDF